MRWPSPEAVGSGAPSYVVDASLSLSPGGPYWVLALTEAAPAVWLAKSHWSIVDDPRGHLGQRDLLRRLAGADDDHRAGAAFARIAQRWQEARHRLALEARPGLFWPADRLGEAVVPKDGDPCLIQRLDALADGFDRRRWGGPPADPLGDCARDTLALAAALGGVRPVVLCALAAGEPEPELAGHLAAAEVPCPRLEPGRLRAALDALVLPTLIRSGLAAALAGGRLRLAALLLAAPRALPAAVEEVGDDRVGDDLAWNAAAAGAEDRLWDDAAAIWWELP